MVTLVFYQSLPELTNCSTLPRKTYKYINAFTYIHLYSGNIYLFKLFFHINIFSWSGILHGKTMVFTRITNPLFTCILLAANSFFFIALKKSCLHPLSDYDNSLSHCATRYLFQFLRQLQFEFV
jgi:hypothetical protein